MNDQSRKNPTYYKQSSSNNRPNGSQLNQNGSQQNSLNWIRTEPSVAELSNQKALVPQSIIGSFAPRKLPYFILSQSQCPCYQLPETEYLIAWTDGLIAIGFINDIQKCANTETTPLLCQFGTWKTEDQKKLHIGSIVVVREYARVLHKGVCRDMVYINIPWHKFFDVGVPRAPVMATEWAIVKEATIIRSIGILTKFNTSYTKYKEKVSFGGEVTDQEHSVVSTLTDEMFLIKPVNVEPKLKSGLVLTWIKLDAPYAFFRRITYRDTLLPAWMNGKYKEVQLLNEEFWLESVSNVFV